MNLPPFFAWSTRKAEENLRSKWSISFFPQRIQSPSELQGLLEQTTEPQASVEGKDRASSSFTTRRRVCFWMSASECLLLLLFAEIVSALLLILLPKKRCRKCNLPKSRAMMPSLTSIFRIIAVAWTKMAESAQSEYFMRVPSELVGLSMWHLETIPRWSLFVEKATFWGYHYL